ncbi:Wzz/FepE/Etk N-terminal domain-containing protein [Polynucleobacter sp. MWH-UH2A]|uniref:Wzz/FepE/Etk N-terminal domain-containing protein n=1 Tax=Polynucleobacter sp. MWH-UH2A TaxID=1855617 RepID=UPI001BFEB343|nr:Wzz/FepE/Etk N-terminal domain-containing protein [Polynucleobacter sp. MWH-UH2A]QWD64354.1 hypothetical protein IC571_01615 [Polynucleobacter sp. MWH-UH2A]
MNTKNTPSSCSPSIQDDQEISLLDILAFLKRAYKTILITGIIGLVAAIAYLAITPKQYEAVAQITMAQIGATNNNNNLNPLGINIEEPALLIARLSSPSSFTPEVVTACSKEDSIQSQANASERLSKSVKLSIPKGVANVVEFKAFGSSPQSAKVCANAIFDLIKNTQAQIVTPYIEEAKLKLADDQLRLQEAINLVAKTEKSGGAMSATYLATRDEIRYLLEEISALKNLIAANASRATRPIAPIYASDQPVSPKKHIALLMGVLAGLGLGLLIALARQGYAKLKFDRVGVV